MDGSSYGNAFAGAMNAMILIGMAIGAVIGVAGLALIRFLWNHIRVTMN